MRDKNPFGILPPGWPSVVDDVYLDIDAKAQFFDDQDLKVDEVPFVYDSKSAMFTPLSRSISWDQVRELAILVDIKYKILVPTRGDGSGSYKISQSWRVKYGDKGVLLEAALLEDLGSSGEGKFAVSVDLKTDQPSSEAMLTSTTLLIKLVGGFTDEGIAVSVGHLSSNLGGQTGVYSKTYKLKLGLLAVNQPAAAIQVPEELLKHTVWFDRENQSDLDPVELRRLEDNWVGPLRARAPDLAKAIAGRNCPVYLIGYASVTGRSEAYNRELSANRVFSVENALKSVFSSHDIYIVPEALGQSAAKQKGPSPQEKRVDILIRPDYAEEGIRIVRNGTGPHY
jgi:hypothetical protein